MKTTEQLAIVAGQTYQSEGHDLLVMRVVDRDGRPDKVFYKNLTTGSMHIRPMVHELFVQLVELTTRLTAAAGSFPKGAKRDYARKVAALTITGDRSHGQDVPSTLSASEGARIRTAIDAESDRVRCADLTAGERIKVRCYCDDAEREGVVESFAFGASAPVTVFVDYPEGFTEPGGYEPINPSNYSLDRIVGAAS